jgi:DNA-directed RNA polymerase subunit RPC12/RpoP
MLQPGQRRDGIACPACGFVPVKGMMWMCAPDGCGALFDTFETRARCPQCDAQFSWTACLACGKASAYQAWYASH